MNHLIFHCRIIQGNIQTHFIHEKEKRNSFQPYENIYSDEGDSSSSSDDEGKDSLCDLEGPCCQTLRVPPSSPVLSPEKKPHSGKKKVKAIYQYYSLRYILFPFFFTMRLTHVWTTDG